MKSILILATLLSLSLFCSASVTLADTCGVVEINDVAMFNLCPLLDTTATYNISLSTYNVSFINPEISCGNSNNLVYATRTGPLGCSILADATDPDVSALDSSDEGAGIVLTYSNSGNNGTFLNVTLIVQLSCDSSADTPVFTSVNTSNPNQVVIVGSSSDACPYLSLNQLANFMEEYKVVFVVIFVILGIFICFFGFQTLKVTIFIIATILVTIALGLLAFNFTHLDTPKWGLWVIFAACVVIGLICGVVAVKFEAVGFVSLGLVLGAVGGLFLFNLVLAPFVEGKKYVLYLVCVILAIIGGLIAYKVWKKVVIVATAIIGSYLIVRALSVVIGGFPSEESIASGTASFSGVTYAYLVAIVVLAIGGGYVQYRYQKNNDEDDEQNAYERMMGGNNNGNNYRQNYGQNYGGGY